LTMQVVGILAFPGFVFLPWVLCAQEIFFFHSSFWFQEYFWFAYEGWCFGHILISHMHLNQLFSFHFCDVITLTIVHKEIYPRLGVDQLWK
jgi:hypothetical protein